MVKFVIFLALFISSVYANNEPSNMGKFSESNLPPGETQTKPEEEKHNVLDSIIDGSIEEKRITNPCKVDEFDRIRNSKESNVSINKKDTKLESTSIDNINSLIKTSLKNNFESINEGNKNSTTNTKVKRRATIDLPQDTLPTRRIIPGKIEKPSKQELNDNKLYQNKALHDDDSIRNSRRNIDDIFNSFDSEKVKKRNVDKVTAQDVLEEESSESKIFEPTIGKGIFDMKNTKVMLMENARVCYACSTMSNPTCWSPDKRTTVKYCQKGHHACLTKTFQHKGTSLIIRDCGRNCEHQNGYEKYSTCTMCHSDLCNGASVMIYNTGVAMIILLGILYNRY